MSFKGRYAEYIMGNIRTREFDTPEFREFIIEILQDHIGKIKEEIMLELMLELPEEQYQRVFKSDNKNGG